MFLSDKDRNKLLKLLAMFSSNHDGEVNNAARMAHELMKRNKLDWADLIATSHETAHNHDSHARNPPPPSALPQWIKNLLAMTDDSLLTDWEVQFILGMRDKVQDYGARARFSDKQRAVLARIYTTVFGVPPV